DEPIASRSDATSSYRTPRGARCTTDFGLGKAVLAVLEKNWPVPTAFGELLRRAHESLSAQGNNPSGTGEDSQRLSTFLLELYAAGVVELHAHAPGVVRSVSPRPSTTPLVRWQAQHSQFATSQLHIAVKIEDEIGKCLLSHLDGTRDRRELVEKIWELLKS